MSRKRQILSPKRSAVMFSIGMNGDQRDCPVGFEQGPLRKRLVERMGPLLRSRRHESTQAGLRAFGPQLFGYCAFAIERLACVRLPHPTIIIVLSGSKEIWLGDASRHLQAGEVFVLPANLDFDVVNIPDERTGLYEALVLEVPALPAGLIDTHSVLVGTPGDFDICIPLTADLVDALEHAAITLADSSHAKALAEHRLAEVLLLLQNIPAARPLFASSLADQVNWLVLGAPSRDWTAAEIASNLGIGASTMRRRLAADGQSLRQIMLDCRMKLARNLLTTGHSNVAQAAEAAGYASRSHFARRFRRAHGVSPSRVRGT